MKDKLTQVQKCHSLINSHGFRNILAPNIASNIAKGTTDPGIDCFNQINNSKITQPLLKPLNFIHITQPLLSFQIHWSQILEISKNRPMLVCLIRQAWFGIAWSARFGLVCLVWLVWFGLTGNKPGRFGLAGLVCRFGLVAFLWQVWFDIFGLVAWFGLVCLIWQILFGWFSLVGLVWQLWLERLRILHICQRHNSLIFQHMHQRLIKVS